MMLALIVAMDENRVIGIRGSDMPWGRTLKDDRRRFWGLTVNHSVIMGRKTLTDDLKKPLKDRRNIVLTHNPFFHAEGCEIIYSWEEAKDRVKKDTAFVIGGAEIYSNAIPDVSEMHITLVDTSFEGDVLTEVYRESAVYFPEYNEAEWFLVGEHFQPENERNAFSFTAQHWKRR